MHTHSYSHLHTFWETSGAGQASSTSTVNKLSLVFHLCKHQLQMERPQHKIQNSQTVQVKAEETLQDMGISKHFLKRTQPITKRATI